MADALTRRHAEILELLYAAGATGLTAGQLSRSLYGDGDHTITVRAEISRLRRLIGALVATKPYRVADGVTLSVAHPFAPRPDQGDGGSGGGVGGFRHPSRR